MLTEKQAIKETKELWKMISNSGLSKGAWLLTEVGKKWLKEHDYDSACPLCQYVFVGQSPNSCNSCPLVKQTGENCVYHNFDTVPAHFYEVVKGLK